MENCLVCSLIQKFYKRLMMIDAFDIGGSTIVEILGRKIE